MLRVLLLCGAAAGVAQSASFDGRPNQAWTLTTTAYGPHEAMIGLGHVVGGGFWVTGSIAGNALQYSQEDATWFDEVECELKLRMVVMAAGLGLQKDLIESDRLRVRGGGAIGINWTRGKLECPSQDALGSQLSGELTGFLWEVGPSLELETPIHGPLSLALYVEPIRYVGGSSGTDGLISWFREESPERNHERGLRTEIDPSLLVRLRF